MRGLQPPARPPLRQRHADQPVRPERQLRPREQPRAAGAAAQGARGAAAWRRRVRRLGQRHAAARVPLRRRPRRRLRVPDGDRLRRPAAQRRHRRGRDDPPPGRTGDERGRLRRHDPLRRLEARRHAAQAARREPAGGARLAGGHLARGGPAPHLPERPLPHRATRRARRHDVTQSRTDHRRDRPGRRLSRRPAARQGLRGARHQAPRLAVQHRPRRPPLPGPARRGPALHAALRRPHRLDQPDPHHPAGAARRDLQPGGDEPRGGELRDARVHRQRRRHRHAAPAGGDPHPGPRKEDALLPGEHVGAVRAGAGGAADRDRRRSTRAARTPWPSSTPTGSR